MLSRVFISRPRGRIPTEAASQDDDSSDPLVPGCITNIDGFEDMRMSDLAREVDIWRNAGFYKEAPDGTLEEVAAPDWLEDDRRRVREWRARAE